jgi:hypothetical protein
MRKRRVVMVCGFITAKHILEEASRLLLRLYLTQRDAF